MQHETWSWLSLSLLFVPPTARWRNGDEEGNRTLLGSMDSIQFISLIVEIEECFNIEIPDEYLVTELFENDEHMIDIIEQLIKK